MFSLMFKEMFTYSVTEAVGSISSRCVSPGLFLHLTGASARSTEKPNLDPGSLFFPPPRRETLGTRLGKTWDAQNG